MRALYYLLMISSSDECNDLLSAVDKSIDKLSAISSRMRALINDLLAVDKSIDKLPAIYSK